MQLLFNRYEVKEVIGEGNFGRVLRAVDVELGRNVAIKELRRSDAERGSSDYAAHADRFRREAKLQAQFTHPNIVQVIELLDSRDALYLVMEYVDGGDLKSYLAQHGKLSPNAAIPIIQDVLAGLQHVHDHPMEIVHRDIKPSNILLTRTGEAKLADFGLAQVADESLRSQGRGQSQPGTQAYMSPEQATTTGYLYPESDIYSVGLVLFELLTGQKYVSARRSRKPLTELLAGVSTHIVAAIEKAFAQEPLDRWSKASAFASALTLLATPIAETPIVIAPVNESTMVAPVLAETSSRRVPYFIVGMIALLLVGVAIWQAIGGIGGGGTATPISGITQTIEGNFATGEPTATRTSEPTNTKTTEPTDTVQPTATTEPDTPTPLVMTKLVEVIVTATAEPTERLTNIPVPTDTSRPATVPTFTLQPVPTNTPRPVPTATPRPSTTNTLQPTATSTTHPTITLVPTSTPNWNATLTANAPTSTPRPTATMEPTNTPRPTATNTTWPTNTPTATPQPLATNTPRPTTSTISDNNEATAMQLSAPILLSSSASHLQFGIPYSGLPETGTFYFAIWYADDCVDTVQHCDAYSSRSGFVGILGHGTWDGPGAGQIRAWISNLSCEDTGVRSLNQLRTDLRYSETGSRLVIDLNEFDPVATYSYDLPLTICNDL